VAVLGDEQVGALAQDVDVFVGQERVGEGLFDFVDELDLFTIFKLIWMSRVLLGPEDVDGSLHVKGAE
jgi:hypothetical protein